MWSITALKNTDQLNEGTVEEKKNHSENSARLQVLGTGSSTQNQGFPGRRDRMGVARRCGDVAISGVGGRYRHQWYADTISRCSKFCAKTFEITTTRTQAAVPDHDHNLQQGDQEIQFSQRQNARLKGNPKNTSLKMPTVVQSIPCLRSGRWSLKFERKKEIDTNLNWTMISEDLEGLFGSMEIINPPCLIGLTDVNGQELPSIKERDHYRINDVGRPRIFWDWGLWQYGLWSFQTGCTKLERFLHKNQHTQRKLLNFENWTNGEPQ